MRQIKKVRKTSLETSGYELPIASADTLGGIKIGENLTIDEDGVLSAVVGEGSISGSSTIDTLPVGSVVMYNGDDIPEGYIELENYEPTYSLEEQVIGTWIDGKTIYRRVVEFTFSSTQNTWNLVVSQPFASLVNCYGYLKDTTTFMPFPTTNGNEVLSVYGNGTTGFYEKHNYEYPGGKSGYLIIEYTKTTD